MSTAIVIPTYNERDNVEKLVAAIGALPITVEIVIVDDNSPDGTGALAESLRTTYPRLHVVHRTHKAGLGTAYKAGFRYAFGLNVEHIMTMDADFSHPPASIPALIAQAVAFDLVIGSRYVPGGSTINCTLARRALSHGANAFARFMLSLDAGDCTAGFRCYRREVLETIDLESILSDGYSFLIEMLYRCQRHGFRIGEVPITFVNRAHGASKISRQEIFKAMWTVLRLAGERLRHRSRAVTRSVSRAARGTRPQP